MEKNLIYLVYNSRSILLSMPLLICINTLIALCYHTHDVICIKIGSNYRIKYARMQAYLNTPTLLFVIGKRIIIIST